MVAKLFKDYEIYKILYDTNDLLNNQDDVIYQNLANALIIICEIKNGDIIDLYKNKIYEKEKLKKNVISAF